MMNRLKNMGPGVLVAAAFIGPGTITACTFAGANYGYALLWALLFATLATIVLQEMSARLGAITQKGLGEVLADSFQGKALKWPLFGLVLVSLYGGNAAYEASNLVGAALGVEAIVGSSPLVFKFAIIALMLVGGFVLVRGNYKTIERVLIGLVSLMGLSFVLTFIVVKPSAAAMLSGLFVPNVPEGSLLTVIALVGTTVVPYNLFLHASAVKTRWAGETNLAEARADTVISIGLGGLITLFVVSTAAASLFAQGLRVTSAADMAIQFEPLFGVFSKYLLGIGLFAAGLSSTITAPLATSYAVAEILGIKGGVSSPAFRFISISILIIGGLFAIAGIKPIQLIMLAQFANGLLLPIIAGFLLYAMNRRDVLGDYANGYIANTLGAVVLLMTAGLGIRMIAKAFGF